MKSKDKIEVEELVDSLSEKDNGLLALACVGILEVAMTGSERAKDKLMDMMRDCVRLYDAAKKKDQS